MTPIPVARLAPGNQWDCNVLDLLFANRLFPTGLEFERFDAYPVGADGIILIIPGRYWAGHEQEITEAIRRYEWVLAIRTGDEEDLFDIAAVEHPAIHWWIQTPRPRKDYGTARFLPLGYPPHFNDVPDVGKSVDVFLSAQCTHQRRAQAFDALARVTRTKRVQATAGFTQGMPANEYTGRMAAARVAPAPSGAVSPDSFRVYEALEAHTIPIADDVSPVYDSRGYWQRMFPDAPFPVLTDYDDLPGYIDDCLRDYPQRANRVTAWWIARKRELAASLQEDLTALSANPPKVPNISPITVLVTCSPIPSHPNTEILEETIESVRAQLPDAEIILSFDGVRAEQEHRRADYEAFIQRALWLADHRWGNVLPLIHAEHLHQAVCTKRALEHVRTPLMLFVEHDTPLTGEIPWGDLAETILAGDANVIRMHHEASVLEPHRYLMLDDEPQKVRSVPMMRTIQWSQRPHLASVAWYRELLGRWFPADEKDFIEDVVYGRLITAHERDGDMGWMGWRTWIYTPDGDIKRSYHTDGRAGEDKFDG